MGGVGRIKRRRIDTSNAKDVEAAATVAQSTQPIQDTKYLLTHPLTYCKQVKCAKDEMAEKGAVSIPTAPCTAVPEHPE